MAEKETLIQKFAKKHFTNTPSHMLRSISVGKFLHSYFMPGTEVPENPATLLNETYTVLTSNERDFSDEDFVRVMLSYINQEPGLVTFDMIADLLESDAYKKFGHGANDKNLKGQFENWLINGSMLSHLDLLSSFEVFYNINSIKRTAAALRQGGFREHAEYINQIDQQLENKKQEFDETFVNHADDDAFEKLVATVNDKNLNYVDKLKNIYNILCDEEHANFLANNLDAITMGADRSQTRNAMIEGAVLTANKILYAYAKRKGLTKEQFKQLYLKFKVDERAEQFEEHAAQLGAMQENAIEHEAQNNSEQNANVESAQVNETVVPNEASDELADEQPNRGHRPQVKFNPVFDIVKTFGITLGGATAISAISAIPGVGPYVGPALAITTIVSAGIISGFANLHKAQAEAKARGEKLKKSDGAKIALKAGIAMIGKAFPYAAAMLLGPKWRAVAAGFVMVKSTLRDLERRANLQREVVEQLEAQAANHPKGIRARLKNFLNHCKNVVHNVNKNDVAKSVAYGLGKGAAVYLGGQIGREIGSNLSFSHKDGLSVRLDTEQIKKDLSEDKLVKFVGNTANHVKDFKNRFVATPEELQQQAENAYGNTYRVLKTAGVATAAAVGTSLDGSSDLSDENLARLQGLGKIELTDNARLTAYSANNKQFFNGKRELLYNEQQEKAMIGTMEKLGVKDPYGLLRKLYSTVQFERSGEIENNGFSETMNHLENGFANNHDVDNLIKSDEIINKEGGLGRIITQTQSLLSRVDNNRFESSSKVTVLENSEPAAEQQPNSVPVSRVDNDRFDTEVTETVLAQNSETNVVDVDNSSGKLSSVGNNRFETGMKESVLDENFTGADVVQPDVEPVNTSRVDNDRFDLADTVNILSGMNETSVAPIDDATTLVTDTKAPTWENDGSYASKVYQDLVAKCDYVGTTLDGSYSFTDKDGTYYEISPDTHEMHISRFSIDGGADIRAVELTNNDVTQDMLKAHAVSADAIGQNLARSSYSAQEAEILELTKSAHEILANPDTSFVDRQRAIVQLERLNAWLGDIKIDQVENNVENVVEPVVNPKEDTVIDNGTGINADTNANANQAVEDVREANTEKLSEFNPQMFDNLKIKLDLNDINEQDEIKFEAPVENAIEVPEVNETEPEIKTPETEQEQPNFNGEMAFKTEDYNWDL